MSQRMLIGAVCCLIAGAVTVTVFARSVIPPPKPEQIADTWVGYTEDGLNFYRLTLNKDGSGLCAFTFTDDPALLYTVSLWELDKYQLEVWLKPVDEDAEPIRITGKTAGWHLDANVSGKGWDRDLKFYRESEVQAAHKRVQERMDKHLAGQGDDAAE